MESASRYGALHVPCFGVSVPNPRGFHQLEQGCHHDNSLRDSLRESQVGGVFHHRRNVIDHVEKRIVPAPLLVRAQQQDVTKAKADALCDAAYIANPACCA